MSTHENCVNARLVRFEQGAFSDIPNAPSSISRPYYFAFVFLKGTREHKEIVQSDEQPFDLGVFLPYIGKIVEKVEEVELKTVIHFTDDTNVWLGSK